MPAGGAAHFFAPRAQCRCQYNNEMHSTMPALINQDVHTGCTDAAEITVVVLSRLISLTQFRVNEKIDNKKERFSTRAHII